MFSGGGNLLSNDYENLMGINEVVQQSYYACKNLFETIISSFGPAGKDKLIIENNDTAYISADKSTILKNVKFAHPTLKLIIFSAIYHDLEMNEGCGFLFIFSVELISQALILISKGFSTITIVKNFQFASEIVLNLLEKTAIFRIKNVQNLRTLTKLISGSIKSSSDDIKLTICPQIAYICARAYYKNKSGTPTDNVRVVKILGGSVKESRTIVGTIVLKGAAGSIQQKKNACLALFSSSFDISLPETKSSNIWTSAEQLINFDKGEDSIFREKIENLVSNNVNVVVASGFSDKIISYLDKYGIMAIRVQSRYDQKRVSTATGAKINATTKIDSNSKLGMASLIAVRSFGNQKIVIFQNEEELCPIFTLIVKSNSTLVLNKIEKAIYKSCGFFRTLCRDNRLIPGAGRNEIQLINMGKKLTQELSSEINSEIFNGFLQAFQSIPLILIENSGGKAINLVPKLHKLFSTNRKNLEVDDGDEENFFPKNKGIWDSFTCKYWAIKAATDNVIMVLSVDQIIMANETTKN